MLHPKPKEAVSTKQVSCEARVRQENYNNVIYKVTINQNVSSR